eukprot:6210301-Pleurochrysis_carterae.AAC.3
MNRDDGERTLQAQVMEESKNEQQDESASVRRNFRGRESRMNRGVLGESEWQLSGDSCAGVCRTQSCDCVLFMLSLFTPLEMRCNWLSRSKESASASALAQCRLGPDAWHAASPVAENGKSE